MTSSPEIVVIGGGPAGAAAAMLLARAGRRVLLLERESGPHDKVCGEFLSAEALAYQASLGLDAADLGAQPITAVRFQGRSGDTAATLPFPAAALSRRTLDAALIDLARRDGAAVRQDARVLGLTRRGGTWHARLRTGEIVSAETVFLATGKHDLRGYGRPIRPGASFVAFKQHLALPPEEEAALRGHVELIPIPRGYAGLLVVAPGVTNLCFVLRRERFRSIARDGRAMLANICRDAPQIERRLAGARVERPQPLALGAIPYGHVSRGGDGLWRLGDQAAVIPSFTGDGIAMALHSAHLAARCYLAGLDADTYQQRLARQIRLPMRMASLAATMLTPAMISLAGSLGAMPRLAAAVAMATRVPQAAIRDVGSTTGRLEQIAP